ncbi:F-box/kelch-repeat protein SKIP25-like [Bidens hawaiensis]|uniref:F-box/kelch-repeat protein SKIP25-like n=1 Tax=Bidens hawaiensis TaxID=980011 RepID=UPI00404AAA0B
MLCSLKKSTDTNDGQTIVEDPPLLPGLPNHLAQPILSTIRPSLLSAVCRRWRHLIYTPHFPPFLSLYALVANNSSSNSNSNSSNNNNGRSCLSDSISFHTFDPISSKWTILPPPVTDPPLHLLHRHPSFISRNFTIQSLTVAGCLVLIAATGHNLLPALSHPLVFDPLTGQWCLGPPLTNPRRWCAAGSYRDTVYVASGVGAHYRGEVARMVEKWDVKRSKYCDKLSDLRDEWRWEEVAGLKDGRFSREAVEAVGYKGKICMVNVKGNNIGKEGVVYDVERNQWEKMSPGMVSGWNGAVGVAEEEEVMYVVDEDKGGVSKYDDVMDCWQEVVQGSELLKGPEHMAVGGGKICVVAGGGGRITVVDVVAQPVRMWVVDPPSPGSEVVSLHILRRPCNRL